MATDFISIGFDLRVEASASTVWPDQMLDPRNQSAICADSNVWQTPPEIESSMGGVLSDSMNPLYLYKSLASLRSVCAGLTTFDKRWLFVSITAHPAVVSCLTHRFGPGYFDEYQKEAHLQLTGWRHMGFDVVDLDGMVSGLKGCGYKEPALSDLRTYFLDSLNQSGLFCSASDAAMFAQARGLQVRDHSPFIVVGVLTHDSVTNG